MKPKTKKTPITDSAEIRKIIRATYPVAYPGVVALVEEITGIDLSPRYRQGQRFTRDGEEYIIATTNGTHMILVNLDNGNRWTDGVLVLDRHAISSAEFAMIAGFSDETFKLIEK